MKSLFLSCLFILFSFHPFAQNQQIDSLKQLLSTANEDTSKVMLLNLLSNSYTWSFVDTAIMYAQQELHLSQQLGFEEGIAGAMNNLAGALTTLGNYNAALDFAYKSLSIYRKLKDTLGMVLLQAL